MKLVINAMMSLAHKSDHSILELKKLLTQNDGHSRPLGKLH